MKVIGQAKASLTLWASLVTWQPSSVSALARFREVGVGDKAKPINSHRCYIIGADAAVHVCTINKTLSTTANLDPV